MWRPSACRHCTACFGSMRAPTCRRTSRAFGFQATRARLASTEQPIAHISDAVGCGTFENFNRQFELLTWRLSKHPPFQCGVRATRSFTAVANGGSLLRPFSPCLGAIVPKLFPGLGTLKGQQARSRLRSAHDQLAVGIAGEHGRLPTRRVTASIASSGRSLERGSAHGP